MVGWIVVVSGFLTSFVLHLGEKAFYIWYMRNLLSKIKIGSLTVFCGLFSLCKGFISYCAFTLVLLEPLR